MLNARGTPTARGGRWQVSTVRNAYRRGVRPGGMQPEFPS